MGVEASGQIIEHARNAFTRGCHRRGGEASTLSTFSGSELDWIRRFFVIDRLAWYIYKVSPPSGWG